MRNLIPADIFEECVNNIRAAYDVTASQDNGITYLSFENDCKRGNYVYVDCGEMQGEYIINYADTNKIGIRYSGSVANGTVKTKPYFDWGNLKEGKISIQSLNQFPLIFFILPTPYEVNLDEMDEAFISHDFQFLVIDRIKRMQGEKSFTNAVLRETVREMSDLTFDFQNSVKKHKQTRRDVSFRRSEEIPFGVTFSGESGSSEALIEDAAGCYLQARVNIYKKYC